MHNLVEHVRIELSPGGQGILIHAAALRAAGWVPKAELDKVNFACENLLALLDKVTKGEPK